MSSTRLKVAFRLGGASTIAGFFDVLNGRSWFIGNSAEKNVRKLLDVLNAHAADVQAVIALNSKFNAAFPSETSTRRPALPAAVETSRQALPVVEVIAPDVPTAGGQVPGTPQRTPALPVPLAENWEACRPHLKNHFSNELIACIFREYWNAHQGHPIPPRVPVVTFFDAFYAYRRDCLRILAENNMQPPGFAALPANSISGPYAPCTDSLYSSGHPRTCAAAVGIPQ